MTSEVRKQEGVYGRGRAIRFIHGSSTSDLPVRDIKRKKEPYIEYGWERGENDGKIIGAENFCYSCYQSAVKKLVDNGEEYLFLVTYPKLQDRPFDENVIVGYIRNEDHEYRTEDRVAVIGEIRLYPFENALRMSELGYAPTKWSLGKYGRTFDEEQTAKIVDHFEGCADITEACLEKVLEEEEKVDTQADIGSSC